MYDVGTGLYNHYRAKVNLRMARGFEGVRVLYPRKEERGPNQPQRKAKGDRDNRQRMVEDGTLRIADGLSL